MESIDEGAEQAGGSLMAEEVSTSLGMQETARGSAKSFMPGRNIEYLDVTYWNERFSEEEEYEWFKGYPAFRHLILENVGPNDKVLQVGSGNSMLGEQMYEDGIKDITSTDLSPVVVERMSHRSRERNCAGQRWMVADMMALPFDDGSFDVVIEKGAMDVLLVDNRDHWDPPPEVRERVGAMLRETHRVLSSTGLFISITFGQPHFRRIFFEAEGLTWRTDYRTFGEGFHYFLYILRKGTRDDSPLEAKGREREEKKEHVKPMKFALEHEHMDSEDYLMQINTF